MQSISRRRMILLAGGGTLALGTSLSLRKANAQIVPGPGLRVRRDVNDPQHGPDAVVAYRDAVAAMRALPSNDFRSWVNQSDIHTQHCPHGNWYFLPWHRGYLAAFEEIARELTGNEEFALPYWNWTRDRQMPRAFVAPDVGGNPNPLYDPSRTMGVNDSLPGHIFGQSNIDRILAEQSYQLFGSFKPRNQTSTDSRFQRSRGEKSRLEREPHDFCHGIVGGNMGQVWASPRDPLFWLHHCNVDRLWAHWVGRGRTNETDLHWLDFTFEGNFVARNGTDRIDAQVSGLANTLDLSYFYDDLPPPGPAVAPVSPGPTPFGAIGTFTQPTPASFEAEAFLPVALSAETAEAVTATWAEPARRERTIAFLQDVSAPTNKDLEVRVFLNCSYLTPQTPPDDPHYVGAFTFFISEEHGGGNQSIAMDLTDTVEALARTGETLGEELVVQLMPLSLGGQTPSKRDSFRSRALKLP